MTRTILLSSVAALLVACSGSGSSDDANPASDDPNLTKGEASLVVPLIDEKKKLLSRFNAQAKAKGLKEVPDTMEYKNQAEAKKIADQRDYFADKIQEAVGAKDQPMPAWGPDSFTNWSKKSKVPGLCYKGDPNKVVDVINAGADSVFSDQLVVQGYRYKTTKKLFNGAEDSESDFPDIWKDWKGEGTAILVIASQTDDGDDLNPAIIPKCLK